MIVVEGLPPEILWRKLKFRVQTFAILGGIDPGPERHFFSQPILWSKAVARSGIPSRTGHLWRLAAPDTVSDP